MNNFFSLPSPSTRAVIRKATLVLLFVITTAGFAAHAQSTQPLTVQQALQLGLQNSKVLEISQQKAKAAESKYKQTVDLSYPLVNLNASYSRLSDVPPFLITLPGETEPKELFPVYLNSYQSRLSAQELVFAGFRVKYAKSSADYLNLAAHLDVDKDKDEVAFNIVSAYYNIYKLAEGVVIIDQNLALVKQRIKELQDGEREGITLHSDVVRAQLQQSNFELTRIDAESSLKTATYNFNILIGIAPPETATQIDTASLFSLPALQPLDTYMQMAFATRSDLQSLKTRNLALENNLAVEQKDFWPTVGVGGNLYYANPNSRYIPPTDQFKLTWDVGANLNWNITNLFTNKHQLDEDKAILAQGNTSYDQLSDVVRSDIYSSYTGYTESLQKLTTLQTALSQANENYQLMDSRYKNQVALFSDLNDAQLTKLLAQINYAVGQADLQVAYYKLLKSTGTIQ